MSENVNQGGCQVPPRMTPPPPMNNCNCGCGGNNNGKKERNIDFITAAKLFFTNYANFDGRATRAEFWWAYLLIVIGSMIPFVNFVWGIAVLIPSIAVSVRRFHDINKSGWYYLLFLIPIVNIILMLVWFTQEGTNGDNEYGPDSRFE